MLVWLKYQKFPFWPAVVSVPWVQGGTRAGLFALVPTGS